VWVYVVCARRQDVILTMQKYSDGSLRKHSNVHSPDTVHLLEHVRFGLLSGGEFVVPSGMQCGVFWKIEKKFVGNCYL
jgi:hypothetical protein